MGNSGNCESCAGNNARSQMDMRRQKAMMYENRYNHNQMMHRTPNGCDTCESVRMNKGCDTCGNTRNMNNGCDNCQNAKMRHPHEDCGNSMRDELRGMPLAMGYVPWQNFGCTYEPMEGLRAGTIFPELDKPFYGRKGIR